MRLAAFGRIRRWVPRPAKRRPTETCSFLESDSSFLRNPVLNLCECRSVRRMMTYLSPSSFRARGRTHVVREDEFSALIAGRHQHARGYEPRKQEKCRRALPAAERPGG